jgi:hypothetical protein
MGAVAATFNFAQWQAQFPALAYVPESTATAWWTVAGEVYLNNSGGSPVCSVPLQAQLLNLLTAHLCQLFVPNPASGTGTQPGLVGRISSASEGSVSVSAEYAAGTLANASWYVQTQAGASYWEATKVYRTFRPVPGFTRNPTFVGAPFLRY